MWKNKNGCCNEFNEISQSTFVVTKKLQNTFKIQEDEIYLTILVKHIWQQMQWLECIFYYKIKKLWNKNILSLTITMHSEKQLKWSEKGGYIAQMCS